MKKKILYLLFSVSILFTLFLPAGASEYLPLYDEADLLSDSEESALAAKLEDIGRQNQMEVVVAAVETTGGYSAMEYADDFYDYNGYGYGETRDGLILIVVMDTSDWWISTCGEAIAVFSDAGIEYIGEQIVPYMSAGDFYGAFDEFADQCSTFMAQARTGDPYDNHNLPEEPFRAGTALLVSVVIGFLIALIYTGRLKAQLKTVRPQNRAADYVKSGSMNVTESRDIFLYRNVQRIPRQSSSSGSRGRGGSGTHISSSGARHGGGGGKF